MHETLRGFRFWSDPRATLGFVLVRLLFAPLVVLLAASFITDDNLYINFTDDTALRMWDGGQSCCEHRYMVCDDNLTEYVGAKLTNVISKPASFVDEDYDVHETMFIDFETTNGVFTIVNHNSHNGYYGGFYVEGEITEPWLPKF